MPKIEQEFDGQTFTFRIGDEEYKLALKDFARGSEIKKKALDWARTIDPKAEF